jgi:hypothetical protein
MRILSSLIGFKPLHSGAFLLTIVDGGGVPHVFELFQTPS